ncbi:MAG: hypothetical protein OXH52_02405 [Gammaproteobacteria bacterium]|nr:hypothetical protein [Gammaproteobacteria bacterium]
MDAWFVVNGTESFPDRLARELAGNTVDGAGTLARHALRGLRACIETAEGADVKALLGWAQKLMDARPAIGAIASLLQHWLESMPAAEGGSDDMRTVAIRHCDHVLARADAAFEQTMQLGRARLSGISGSIVTHSASSTVRHLLADLAPDRVIVGASEPGGEGRRLAAELGVRCVSDAEAVRRVAEAGAVLVGADAVGTQTFVNKVGTLALAQAACDADTLFFVVAESFKWVAVADPVVVESAFETVPNALVGQFLSDGLFRS